MKKNNNLTKKIARKMCATGAGFLLATAPTLASCESDGVINYALKADATEFLEDKIDYSNIDLRKQPLRVIRQAVEGEWRVLIWRNNKLAANENSFITFTPDSVIFRYCETVPIKHHIRKNYHYRWEIQYTYCDYDVDDKWAIPYKDYVMRDVSATFPELNALYFYEIQNDTMYGWWEPALSSASHIKLLRVK